MPTTEPMIRKPILPPFAILAIEHNGFLELSAPPPRPLVLRAPWMNSTAAPTETASAP